MSGHYQDQLDKARKQAEREARRGTRKPGKYPSEKAEQVAVLKWLKMEAGLHYQDYAANQEGTYHGDEDHIRGAIARSTGAKKGRPDLEIFARCPRFPDARGCAIEMKSRDPARKASDDQIAWLERLSRNGWVTYCAHGSDDAIDWLKTLGFGSP